MFRHARSSFIPLAVSVPDGEAQGLLMALRWMRDLGIVIFEMDCKHVVDCIHRPVEDRSEFDALVLASRAILLSHPDFKVQFAWRQANGVAHALARVATVNACNRTFSSIPPCIVDIIVNEM